MADDDLDHALALLRTMPAVLRMLLRALPPALVSRPNPEGWSCKDIVAHLHDTEDIAFVTRIRRILGEDRPAIEPIDPPARLLEQGYQTRTLDDLLDDLARQRAEHVTWLATLAAAQLARTGLHSQAGAITPRDLIHQWAYHDLAHTRQLLEMLQADLVPAMGNTRAFYPESVALLAWQTAT